MLINSKSFTEVNANNIPTGQFVPLPNTKFDFSTSKQINDTVIDHNFVVQNDNETAATITSPCGQLSMDVLSDYPGVQVYTGDYLEGELQPRQGLCIEPQFYPDSPNHKHFPFEPLQANTNFSKKIVYKLNK